MAYTFKHGDRPLDDFTIQRAVGRGGFGEVYYAVSDGGREVALKYLCQNPEVELRGVSHCINLKSPHLVAIFDVKKSADGDYFIVMEYSSGPSLRDLLVAEPNGIGPQKAAFFLREIAKGLGYLHDRGIVHRDLKPGNIFFDEGYVKIGDYGLSKFISVSRHSAQTASVGTVHYMAPEVGSGNYHRGIDIYALGVILYEMLLGKVPFEGSSMGEVLMKHLTEQPEVDNLPEPFGRIIRKALQKDPKDRYQDVYAMVDDLLEVEDVKQSLAGFSVASLAGDIPRVSRDADASPSPSPNPIPGFANVGRERPRRQHVEMDARQLPPRMSKRAANIHDKVSRRMKKLQAVHGQPVSPQPAGRGRWPRSVKAIHSPVAELSRQEVVQRVLLALAMAIGLGVIVGFIVDRREEGMAAAIVTIVGMTGGVALGCRFVGKFSRVGHLPGWLERLGIVLPVSLFAGFGAGIFSDAVGDERAVGTWAALMIATVLTSWRSRIASGTRGELSIVQAIWPAAVAMVAAAGLTEKDYCIAMAGGAVAAATLVIQAVAWLFPLARWLEQGSLADTANRGTWHRERASTQDTQERVKSDNAPPPEPTNLGNDSEEPEPQRDFVCGRNEYFDEGRFVVDPRQRRRWITRCIGTLIGIAAIAGIIACIVEVDTRKTRMVAEVKRQEAMDMAERLKQETRMAVESHLQETRAAVENHMQEVRDMRASVRSMAGGRSGHHSVTVPHAPIAMCKDDFVAACAFGAACIGLMIFGFRKSRCYRGGSFYRDNIWPLLLALSLAGVAGTAGGLSIGAFRGTDIIEMIVLLILSAMVLLFLIFARGKRVSALQQNASDENETGDSNTETPPDSVEEGNMASV